MDQYTSLERVSLFHVGSATVWYFPVSLYGRSQLSRYEIRRSLSSFFSKFRDASHLDDVVFDVAFNGGGDPILIEINPSSRSGLSDHCLFEGMQLDGRLRFLGDGDNYDWVTLGRKRANT